MSNEEIKAMIEKAAEAAVERLAQKAITDLLGLITLWMTGIFIAVIVKWSFFE